MKTFTRIVGLTGIACAATFLFAGTASAAGTSAAGHPHHRGDGAVFVQTDSSSGNAIVAYDRAQDGTLTQAGVYPTGDAGGTLTGAVVDR